MTNRQDEYRKTLLRYSIGFILSIFLTLVAFAIVTGKTLIGVPLVATLGGLALVQMIVQLVFFLHMASGPGSRFRLLAFGFMTAVLAIIVVGSLWIMYHLNYNMMEMDASQKDSYMTGERDKGF